MVCAVCLSIFLWWSSNGNIFLVTGPLWGETTGHRWIPLTKASVAEFWCFVWCSPEQMVAQTVDMPLICDAMVPTCIVTSFKWRVGFCVDCSNLGYPTKTHPTLKSCEISFACYVFLCCLIILKFCTDHRYAKFQNGWVTQISLMDKSNFAIFVFK